MGVKSSITQFLFMHALVVMFLIIVSIGVNDFGYMFYCHHYSFP
jgi:hypothetical protein